MLNMRRAIYAFAAACAFTLLPLPILRLESTTKLIQWLKGMGGALGLPGAAVGLIVAGGRIDDVDSGVTDAANFAFYLVAVWLFLKAISAVKARRLTQQGHVVDR